MAAARYFLRNTVRLAGGSIVKAGSWVSSAELQAVLDAGGFILGDNEITRAAAALCQKLAAQGADVTTLDMTAQFMTRMLLAGQGPPGPAGTSFLHGEGAPSDLLGEDEDTYLDTLTAEMYGKASGHWTLLFQMVLSSRTLTAGAGMTGGGDLSANRAFNVLADDTSIVVTADGLSVGVISDLQHGSRSGSTLHAAATTSVNGFMSSADKTKLDGLPASAVPTSRTLTAGAGLTGGGDLSADRTFDVVAGDGSIVVTPNAITVGEISDTQHGARGRGTLHMEATGVVSGFMSAADKTKLDGLPASAVPTSRTLTAGAGLTGGGDLSADRTFDVVANVDGSITVNANDVQVGVLASDTQHGSRGGATQHAVATTSVHGFMSSTDKTKLDGLPSSAVPTSRTLTAGAGMTGGGDLSADRTFNVAANVDGSITVNADDIQVGVLASDTQHGSRGGASQHAVATTSVHGFMSSTDKTKLDAYPSGAGADNTVLFSTGGAVSWSGTPTVTSLTATSYVGVGSALPASGAFRLANAAYLTGATTTAGVVRLIGVDATDRVLIGDGTAVMTIDAGAGDLTLNADIVNLGSGTKPSTGSIRVANAKSFYWASSTGGAVHVLDVDASDVINLGAASYWLSLYGAGIVSLSQYLGFQNTVASPWIGQYNKASGTGENLLVRAQCTASGTGGDLQLSGGTGTTANGKVILNGSDYQPAVTTTVAGFMSGADKTKLDVYPSGAGADSTVLFSTGGAVSWSGTPTVTSLTATYLVAGSGTAPATGAFRLPNANWIYSRTTGGTDVSLLGLDGSNRPVLGNGTCDTFVDGKDYIILGCSALTFDTSQANPSLWQFSLGSGDGQPLTVAAQGTSSGLGGNLLLKSGVGTTNGDVVLHTGSTERHRITPGYEEISSVSHPTSEPTSTTVWEWVSSAQKGAAGHDVRKTLVPIASYNAAASTDAQHCEHNLWYEYKTTNDSSLHYFLFEIGSVLGRTYADSTRHGVFVVKVTAMGCERATPAQAYGAAWVEGVMAYDLTTDDIYVVGSTTQVTHMTGTTPTLAFSDPPDDHSVELEFGSGSATKTLDWTFFVEMKLWNPGTT